MLAFSAPDARLVFSCGWQVPRYEDDRYRWSFRATTRVVSWFARALRVVDVDDQFEAARRHL
ncbi:MAG: hypothetical protein WED09_05170 [Homoserinimonas sp.]